jgi:hypothetical protein
VTYSPYARAPDLSVTLSRIAVQCFTLIFHQHTEAKDVITSKETSEISQIWIHLHVKCQLFFKHFKEIVFSQPIFEEDRISNLMKIRPEGAELFHADGQADTPKLILAFRTFANAPENSNNLRME